MRKTIAILILTAVLISLAGCAGLAQKANEKEAAANASPAPSPTPDMTDILAASAANAETAAQTHTPPASASNTQIDQAGYEKAQQCVGKSLEELYAAIGQPIEEPTYGPSCQQEGAEDGMLTYNGFYVWTVRSDSGEVVQEVYADN